MNWQNSHFIASFLSCDKLPYQKGRLGKPLPDIALIGRSNVGKSSLINHLLKNSSLAKISSSPGKTQTLNYYSIDNTFFLVDLPGYGYAKTTKTNQQAWATIIDKYLNTKKNLLCALLLLDCRRELSYEDKLMIKWFYEKKLPFLIIFTKTDKYKTPQLQCHTQQILSSVKKLINFLPDFIYYSIKEHRGRDHLAQAITKQLNIWYHINGSTR